uniref:Uncharacterized protein n=1 Tax=viral metagenome TaxID=1070528 RepID=A0A6C0HSJ0_9ZZZZ
MSIQNFTKIFNDVFFNLVNAVKDYFPSDPTIRTAERSLVAIRKMNPTLIYRVWVHYVDTPYKNEIQGSNVDFFVNKDYTNDLKDYTNDFKTISDAIDRFREPIKNMDEENQKIIMGYMQTLSKLVDMK